jgi:hypothetical protein
MQYKSLKAMKNQFENSFSSLAIHGFSILFALLSCKEPAHNIDDNFEFALKHVDELRLSTYITAHSVQGLLSTEAGKREAVSLLRANGITKVYLEVYRSGLVVKPELLREVSDYFKSQGFSIVGGIATVPGENFGVAQEGKLGWFNWQNPKTQNDLRQVILNAAPIFDTFIVDDFLCTGDTSVESKAAKGERSWSEYRRALLTDLATSVFIDPARSVNPDIHMIIKYPQWYDRFHMFGYDVETGPKIFNEVWVGTETRGQYTQRFGFVQPYEGFVNYRWLASLAGDKIGGAWFDHGDCDKIDFIEQAYQSVLAGANELVLFSYDAFVDGHAGHHLLRTDFEKLVMLAKAVKESPVVGVPAYKPAQSDAGGDLYIMDFIGMFGVPLIPVSEYPAESDVLFLPAQAVQDKDIISKITTSLEKGTRIILTAGFLANVKDDGKIAALVGIVKPVSHSISADTILESDIETTLTRPLDLEAMIGFGDAEILLEAIVGDEKVPFLTKSKNGEIYVLNTHTFSEDDFEAVGEVLLCPRQLGLLDIPQSWANELRAAFIGGQSIQLDAPTRVTMQTLSNGDMVIHNYNQTKTEVRLTGMDFEAFFDAFSNVSADIDPQSFAVTMEPRSRMWLKKE